MGLVLVSHSSYARRRAAGDGRPGRRAGRPGGDGRRDRRRPARDERAADRRGDPLDPRRAAPTGPLVLLDLGSAALSLELALEEFDADERARLRVSEAPLVEGAILAAVQASVGATLDEVAEAAASAATMPKMPED